jgi:hypothetical protein
VKEWQFNILFFVGVGGAIFLLVGPEFGLSVSNNPTALAGVGSILTYILTQKKAITRNHEGKNRRHEERDDRRSYESPDGKNEKGDDE